MNHYMVKVDNSAIIVTADEFSISGNGLIFTTKNSKVAWFLRWSFFFNMANAHCLSEEQ